MNTPYPPFYAAKLLTYWGRGGDLVIGSKSNYPLLAVHGALLGDGRLALLVINKSATTDFTAQITLNHFLPGSATATIYSYGKSNDLANADLSTSTISIAAANFSVTFPSYSMSVVILQPKRIVTNR